MNRVPRVASPLLALILVAASGVSAFAQETFTPHHVAKIRTVAQVAVAPDGAEIAYVLAVPRIPFQDDDGPAWTELHVVGTDGQSRPYVTGAVNVAGVRWTPDGKGLAFLARRTGDATRSLYIVPRDGGEARKVFAHTTDLVTYEFSPDGKQIAFVARDAAPADRADLVRRGFSQDVFEEGLLLQRLWVAPFDGRAGGNAKVVNVPGHATSITWNPAGTRLAVLYAPTALVDDDLMEKKVHVIDPAMGEPVTKFNNPGKIGQVAWSPDGTTIAMVSAADINDPSEGRLMVANRVAHSAI